MGNKFIHIYYAAIKSQFTEDTIEPHEFASHPKEKFPTTFLFSTNRCISFTQLAANLMGLMSFWPSAKLPISWSLPVIAVLRRHIALLKLHKQQHSLPLLSIDLSFYCHFLFVNKCARAYFTDWNICSVANNYELQIWTDSASLCQHIKSTDPIIILCRLYKPIVPCRAMLSIRHLLEIWRRANAV